MDYLKTLSCLVLSFIINVSIIELLSYEIDIEDNHKIFSIILNVVIFALFLIEISMFIIVFNNFKGAN